MCRSLVPSRTVPSRVPVTERGGARDGEAPEGSTGSCSGGLDGCLPLLGSQVRVAYPLPSTAETSAVGSVSTPTLARPVARSALASSTPGTPRSASSTVRSQRPEHVPATATVVVMWISLRSPLLCGLFLRCSGYDGRNPSLSKVTRLLDLGRGRVRANETARGGVPTTGGGRSPLPTTGATGRTMARVGATRQPSRIETALSAGRA